jgi:hypothetical protein
MSDADGGFAGYNDNPGSTVGSTNITSAYEIGRVSAMGTVRCVGGFSGQNDPNQDSPSVVTSYWDTTTSGQTNGVGQDQGCSTNSGGITGLTSHQLKSGLPNGFDVSIWTRDPQGVINGGFPYLLANPPP